jgi:acyl-CoA dehydrogenase
MPDIAAFARTEIAPHDLSATQGFPFALWKRMGEAGLFRIGLPQSHGGNGGGAVEIAAAERALIRHGGSPGLAGAWAGHQMVARHFIAAHGDPGQQAEYLPALAAGTLTASVAISEPGIGAHPKHLSTSATRDGQQWVLNGTKSWASNGPIAGLFIVLAITGVEQGRKRYSAFLVPRDTAGLTLLDAPTPPGLHPASHCGLSLSGVLLPAEALLGPPGEAYETMALPFRDAEDAVSAVGLAATLQHAIGVLAHELGADMSADTAATLGELAGLAEAASLTAQAAPAALDQGLLHLPEAQAAIIGVRQIAEAVLPRIRALRPAGEGRLDRLLAGMEISLSVARGPRKARAAQLGRGLAADIPG